MNAETYQDRPRGPSSSPSPSPEKEELDCLSARKRAKRRRNKQRQRMRARQAKEQAAIMFQGIIREIYALRANYESVRPILEEWFAREDSSEVIHQALDCILRREVELIRRQIGTELVIFSREDAEGQEECVRAIFENVQRIQRGSAQVEKVFNLFMRRRYGEEEPVRINLDLLTLKFLYRRNLAPSPHFAAVVRLLDQETFAKERGVYQAMLRAASNDEQGQQQSQSDEQEEIQQEDEEVMEQEQDQAVIQVEVEQGWQSPRRRRRKKRPKLDLQVSFQAILQRTAELQIKQEDRLDCNVEQSWIAHIHQQAQQYRRPR